jgi:hypothetical protein
METHSGSIDINTSMKETEQAFGQMKCCITKMQLVNKARSINACSEVMLAVENMPEKEYYNLLSAGRHKNPFNFPIDIAFLKHSKFNFKSKINEC